MAMSAELSTLITHRAPIVVILGASATGKSKLAVDLALKFNGEIVSADSMQVYKGLDILTNKITTPEARGIPHHLISVVDPLTKFDVKNFRNTALPIVERLRQQNKIPIIVGGTNYYIESLIWKILIDKANHKTDNARQLTKRPKLVEIAETMSTSSNEIFTLLDENNGNIEYDGFQNWTNNELHTALEVLDPNRSRKLHPNDRRKTIRSLQVFFQTGRRHSDLIEEQLQDPPITLFDPSVNSSSHGTVVRNENTPSSRPTDSSTNVAQNPNPLGGSMRFQNVVCFWIQIPLDVLEKRISQRVDEMIERGLRDELNNYMAFVSGQGTPLVFTEGLLQSIGFKEFEAYLKLTAEEKCTAELGDKLFTEGVEKLKIATRQYARKQLKWIRQRFLRPSRRQVPPVYWLDGSNTDEWDTNVTSVSTKILDCYVSNRLDNEILSERRVPETAKPFDDDLVARTCEICDNRILIGTEQWEIHMTSFKHRKMVKKKKEQKIVEELTSQDEIIDSKEIASETYVNAN